MNRLLALAMGLSAGALISQPHVRTETHVAGDRIPLQVAFQGAPRTLMRSTVTGFAPGTGGGTSV